MSASRYPILRARMVYALISHVYHLQCSLTTLGTNRVEKAMGLLAGVWGTNLLHSIHRPLPWPLQDGLLMRHAMLLAVFCCGVQQFSGQTWRIFVKGVSGQVGCSSSASCCMSLPCL